MLCSHAVRTMIHDDSPHTESKTAGFCCSASDSRALTAKRMEWKTGFEPATRPWQLDPALQAAFRPGRSDLSMLAAHNEGVMSLPIQEAGSSLLPIHDPNPGSACKAARSLPSIYQRWISWVVRRRRRRIGDVGDDPSWSRNPGCGILPTPSCRREVRPAWSPASCGGPGPDQ